MPTNYVSKLHFDQVIGEVNKKLDKLNKISEQLDWLVGKYQGHDEEHTLLNNKVSEQSNNLELVNQKLGIQI